MIGWAAVAEEEQGLIKKVSHPISDFQVNVKQDKRCAKKKTMRNKGPECEKNKKKKPAGNINS